MINIEVICKPRGCGKTYDLIMESARTGSPILTLCNSRYILRQANEMGVRIPEPMTYGEYEHYRGNRRLSRQNGWNGKLLIDEVDKILNEILDANVEIVTCTPDSMNERGNDMYLTKEQLEAYEELMKRYCTNPENITDINIIVPNKVVEVTFGDGKKEKMVRHEEDIFNLRNCLFIAIAKHLYRDLYTFEGIEWKAFELTHLKKYVKIVDSALKAYDKKQKEIEKTEADRKSEQERIERKRTKRQAYKERRSTKREQEERDKQIEIQKEAYIQAMKCIGEKNEYEFG